MPLDHAENQEFRPTSFPERILGAAIDIGAHVHKEGPVEAARTSIGAVHRVLAHGVEDSARATSQVCLRVSKGAREAISPEHIWARAAVSLGVGLPAVGTSFVCNRLANAVRATLPENDR